MPVYYKGFKIKKEDGGYIANNNNKVCVAKSYDEVKRVVDRSCWRTIAIFPQYSNDYNCLYKGRTTGEELAEIYSKYFAGGRK